MADPEITQIPTVLHRTRIELYKLASEKEHFRALFEMGPVAIYSCDAAGIIDNCNARAVELWGRSPEPSDTDEKFCGSYRLYRPDGTYMPHHLCPMALVVDGTMAEVRDEEVIIERPDGSRVTVIVNIRPLTNEQGQITGAINCFYDITERKRLEEALRESNDNLEHIVEQRTMVLRQLSSRLIRAQDDERRRISRELHDGVGQYLAHMKMRLNALKDARGTNKESEIFTDLLETVEQCSTETRTLSYLLHPPLLDELGLAATVEWYVQGFAQRSGIRVNIDISSSLNRLSNELEILLFRVLQESLTNIHRHSQARSVDVRLELGNNEVLLQIKDNGQGLSAESLEQFRSGSGGGVGLRSMRERINEAGGQFRIESDSSGALVCVKVPLSKSGSSLEIT